MSNQNPSYNYCAVPLASYACRADQSVGRVFNEPESDTRTCFQRDRDRVIHASAFRRLKYKTQVFVYSHGDNYRTRLTHTLEVAQVARTLARALFVNEDLTEVIALAHDLGHPPFAHTGEDILVEAMKKFGGFEHNDQSLRVVTLTEEKYPSWDGLNLTWETLEGIVKHNGPVSTRKMPYTLERLQKQTDLRLKTYASLEAQIAAVSDDVAYNNHDVEDGLSANLFTLDDIAADVPLMARSVEQVQKKYPALSGSRLNSEVIRTMIGEMVADVLAETRNRIRIHDIKTVEDIRGASDQMVAFSSSMFADLKKLRAFLFDRMYLHYTVNRMRYKAEKIIGDLFGVFLDRPECMPNEWQDKVTAAGKDKNEKARVVCDYIAGMTDRYAKVEHARLFDLRGE
ncbi:MAG: deoxyguanosinetriphosphate triphosphohydrolase [Alphaproteobacteria bacterium]|nr:MAG: deoxyguanosinetriphosphate triphosphohydrolase [Alphaproteobacteria bacterium]